MCYKRALEKCFSGITVSFKTNRIRLFSFGCVREELMSPVLWPKDSSDSIYVAFSSLFRPKVFLLMFAHETETQLIHLLSFVDKDIST